jgi:hypothetical protein
MYSNQKVVFTKDHPSTITLDNNNGIESLVMYTFHVVTAIRLYRVENVPFRNTLMSGDVDIDVYGLRIEKRVITDGIETVQEINKGMLTAHQNQVAYLVNLLCRQPISSDGLLHAMIEEEVSTWNNNPFGNPYQKVAETKFKQKKKNEYGSTNPASLSNLKRRPTNLERFNLVSQHQVSNSQNRGLNI